MIRHGYLLATRVAAELLADPVVAAAWDRPSALPEFRVSALAGHLGRQITQVPVVLAEPVPGDPPVSLVDHYLRARWTSAGLADETNVRVRQHGAEEASAGAQALVRRVNQAVGQVAGQLAAEPPDRQVFLPWAEWSLLLDDFLITRLVEIAVHCDDLAVSVGIDPPTLPDAAIEPALDLLARLAVHRHGTAAVLRALTRAERAPATIAAF